MAGFGICDRLVRRNLHTQFDIVLFGEEPRPAYDRVNLSQLFSGRSAGDLLLAQREWYDQHQIRLETNRRVVRIDTGSRLLWNQDGKSEPFDRLVLATGSSPWVPPIEGTEHAGVFVYRTIDDLEAIRDYVIERGAKNSAVIGGGLLGLEAARVMLDLNLSTSIIEVAPGLMPRQLDAVAARVLKRRVEALGVAVHLTRRTARIERAGDKLQLHFDNAPPQTVDVLVIAAGIRPRDELAASSGLERGRRGGFAVNQHLETNVPGIYAIGECASLDDYTYGLVAPCYRMADVLADRLAGLDSEFVGADESAELKLLGVPVRALGRAIGQSRTGVIVTHEDEAGYRKIILEQGRVAGAAGVGDWDDIDSVRLAVGRQQRLWPHQRGRFARTGRLSPASENLTIHQWPADATVCSCLGITRGALTAAIDDGANRVETLAVATGASSACGSCRNLLCELVGDRAKSIPVAGASALLLASLVSLLLTTLIGVLPPIPLADSVQDGWRQIDFLWRDNIAKQISGYSLLGLLVLGLAFSVRKRTRWLRFGSYGFWRAAHGVLGAAALLGVIVHTGFRMGANLNFLLSSVLLAVAMVGALAGVASGLESRTRGEAVRLIRSWRPKLARLHVWLFWPLPVLLAIHIISVYWY